MENFIINLLKEKGYSNEGSNRSYAIKTINKLIESGFLELEVTSYEENCNKGGFYFRDNNGDVKRTLYKIKMFKKTYYGHPMTFKPSKTYYCLNGEKLIQNVYQELDLKAILLKVSRIISINKQGFDTFKKGVCNCLKCSGSGIIKEYMYYANGICFDCLGTGINNDSLKSFINNNTNI